MFRANVLHQMDFTSTWDRLWLRILNINIWFSSLMVLKKALLSKRVSVVVEEEESLVVVEALVAFLVIISFPFLRILELAKHVYILIRSNIFSTSLFRFAQFKKYIYIYIYMRNSKKCLGISKNIYWNISEILIIFW